MPFDLNIEIVPLSEVPMETPDVSSGKDQHVILIVDDEQVIADTLSIILKKNGYTVFTAYNGESALELARLVPPELLIADVMMPRMTGIELAIALTQTISDCKVLLFSGQAATQDLLLESRDRGHDFEIMSKPVHPTDMLRRIVDCLNLSPVISSLGEVHDVFVSSMCV